MPRLIFSNKDVPGLVIGYFLMKLFFSHKVEGKREWERRTEKQNGVDKCKNTIISILGQVKISLLRLILHFETVLRE